MLMCYKIMITTHKILVPNSNYLYMIKKVASNSAAKKKTVMMSLLQMGNVTIGFVMAIALKNWKKRKKYQTKHVSTRDLVQQTFTCFK